MIHQPVPALCLCLVTDGNDQRLSPVTPCENELTITAISSQTSFHQQQLRVALRP